MSTAISVVVGILVGAFGVAGVLLFAVVANPEKVHIWGSMLLGLLRRVTKRAELAYVASDVASRINNHLAHDVVPGLAGLSATRLAVRWDNSGDAVAMEAAGTLIVRLRQHEDRLSNILNAYIVAAPRMYAPTLRSQLAPTQSRAIDLQLCRKLAESLSRSAITVYRLNILDPSVAGDARLVPLLEKLNAIDLGGLFVPVLLQELVKLGSTYPADSLPNLDSEVRELISFLAAVAERGKGEDVELSYLGQHIRVCTLLVARQAMRAKGVEPFRYRVGLELAKGVDTFYLMATDANIEFALEVANALDSDRRLLRCDDLRIIISRDGDRRKGIIIPFERNLGYTAEELLEEGVKSGHLASGTEHEAIATDVQPSYVAVDVDGVQGIVPIREVSWFHTEDCRLEVGVGDRFRATITKALPGQQELVVSRRASTPNPLDSIDQTTLKGSRQVLVVTSRGGKDPRARFVAGYLRSLPSIPAKLYEEELEWGGRLNGISQIADGEELEVLVHDLRVPQGYAACSRKRLCADQWGAIRKKYPNGTRLAVDVTAVGSEGVWCNIEPGLVGFVPAAEFRQAGLEYRDFEANIRVGQELFVHVQRVVAGERRRVTLGLQRNIRTPP